MSRDEEMMVIGRTLTDFSEIRKKVTSLLSVADKYKSDIQRVIWYLEPPEHTHSGLKHGENPPDLSNFPTREQLQSVIDEALSAMKRKQELKSQLKEYGAEPKD